MSDKQALAADAERGTARPVTGLRRGAFLGYQWLLLAFLLAGAAQIFLAGLGVFGLFDTGGDTFAPHRTLGFAAEVLRRLMLRQRVRAWSVLPHGPYREPTGAVPG